MAKLITVQPGQTLENVALQHYGSVDAVVDLVWDNRALLTDGFSSDLEGGMKLSIREVPYDPAVVSGVALAQVVPTSGTVILPVPMPNGGDYNADYNPDHLTD
ncbi:MAG: hypothetical protein JNL05_10600 [Flavobacteriales bacterium]|nr:hypothetical protein [Flavobacteriales bacterium]